MKRGSERSAPIDPAERVGPNTKAIAAAALKPLAIVVCPIVRCGAALRFEPRMGGYVAICPDCEARILRLAALEATLGARGKPISVFGSAKYRQRTVGTVVVRVCERCATN